MVCLRDRSGHLQESKPLQGRLHGGRYTHPWVSKFKSKSVCLPQRPMAELSQFYMHIAVARICVGQPLLLRNKVVLIFIGPRVTMKHTVSVKKAISMCVRLPWLKISPKFYVFFPRASANVSM